MYEQGANAGTGGIYYDPQNGHAVPSYPPQVTQQFVIK